MDQFELEDDTKTRPGVPVDSGRIVQALRRHWKVLPISVAAGALLGLVIAALLIKPAYTAKATVLWEPHAEGEPSDRSFLTQVDSIKLTSNLQEVKKRLHSKLTVDELKEKINLLFDGQSHLVVVEANDASAKGSMALAKTVVAVFLDYQRSIGHDRGSEHLRHVEADIAAAHTQLDNARAALDGFRRELGVADYEIEHKTALATVTELERLIQTSETEVTAAVTTQRSLTAELAKLPATTFSVGSSTNPDQIELARLKTSLASESNHLSPEHPTIQRIQGNIAALENKIKTGVGGTVTTGTTVTRNAQRDVLETARAQAVVNEKSALQRGTDAKAALIQARERLAKFSASEGRAQQLLSAVAAQETHVNELEAQRVRTRDQVRSAAADFRVVTPATLPDKPNPSTRRAVVIRMPIVALIIALLGIVAYELRGLRVHTAREAGFWANAAVVASSTWPREQTTLRALVDELSDAAPAVRGTTLVVGARVNEVPLAREIAYWLSQLTAGLAQRGIVGADQPVMAMQGVAAVQGRSSAQPIAAESGTALAHRTTEALAIAQAWDGPADGQSLRRASRLADRVLVVVAAGTMSVTEIGQLRARLGRSTGIGLLLVGLNPEFIRLPDRVGEVDRFWEDRAA
ncbi:MAG: hypothetical protein RL701_3124 [Pseudomonadota bacterium]